MKPSPHITEFRAENVKKIRAVRIAPEGRVVEISGANASGKSSLLDGIMWALAGKRAMDREPVRHGEEEMLLELRFGDVLVRRTQTAEGEDALEVVNAESGAKMTAPQRWLESMLGKSGLIFDQEAFDRMSPKEKQAELQKIAPPPPSVAILESEIAGAMERRKEINRKARDLEGELRARPLRLPTGYDPKGEAWQIESTDPLLQQLTEVGGLVAAAADELRRREAKEREIQLQRDTAQKRREEAARMIADAERLEQLAKDAETILGELNPIPKPPDATQLQRQLQELEAKNRERLAFAQRWQAQRKVEELEGEAKSLTVAIEGAQADIVKLMSGVAMPVPGLSYSAEGVRLNGAPLEQASSAERIRVALAMRMAEQPALRIVIIKNASLLDPSSKAVVAEMCAERDYQAWCEVVDVSGGVGIFLVDGEIAAVNRAHADREDELARRDPLEPGSLV